MIKKKNGLFITLGVISTLLIVAFGLLYWITRDHRTESWFGGEFEGIGGDGINPIYDYCVEFTKDDGWAKYVFIRFVLNYCAGFLGLCGFVHPFVYLIMLICHLRGENKEEAGFTSFIWSVGGLLGLVVGFAVIMFLIAQVAYFVWLQYIFAILLLFLVLGGICLIGYGGYEVIVIIREKWF